MSARLELEVTKPQTMAPPYIVPSKIDELPQDLLDKIFSYLNKQDLQALTSVNWSMHTITKEAANRNEPSSIKNFIQILLQRLNAETFSTQREKLIKISEYIASQNCTNLRQLKSYILDVKAELINVIKTLDPETENDLRDHVQLPHFLEDIFELATFERRIDKAIVIPAKWDRSYTLKKISVDLAKSGNIDRAIEVATSNSYDSFEFYRSHALKAISRALARTGNIDRAIEVAMLISDQDMKENGLRRISQISTEIGNMDNRAIVLTWSILNETVRGLAL